MPDEKTPPPVEKLLNDIIHNTKNLDKLRDIATGVKKNCNKYSYFDLTDIIQCFYNNIEPIPNDMEDAGEPLLLSRKGILYRFFVYDKNLEPENQSTLYAIVQMFQDKSDLEDICDAVVDKSNMQEDYAMEHDGAAMPRPYRKYRSSF